MKLKLSNMFLQTTYIIYSSSTTPFLCKLLCAEQQQSTDICVSLSGLFIINSCLIIPKKNPISFILEIFRSLMSIIICQNGFVRIKEYLRKKWRVPLQILLTSSVHKRSMKSRLSCSANFSRRT